MSVSKDRFLLTLILLATAGLRLSLAWLPTEVLILKSIPDDSFYYFALARNLSRGLGPVVTDSTITNGFHPLWALLLWPLYSVVQGDDLAIHAALSLGAVLDVLTIWLTYLLVKELGMSSTAGLISAMLYGLNPLVIMESINGLETALSVFLFVLTVYIYFVPLRFSRAISLSPYILFGISTGLMLLARTDTLFLVITLTLHALWVNRRNLPSFLPRLIIAGATASLLVLPWLWWNWANFGTIMQSSAIAAPKVVQAYMASIAQEATSWGQLISEAYLPPIYSGFVLLYQYGGLPLTILVAIVILQRMRRVSSRNLLPNTPAVFWLPLIGASLPLLVHVFVRWYPRNWYFVTWAWAMAFAAGPAIAYVLKSLSNYLLKGLIVGLLLIFFVLQGVRYWNVGFYPWQGYMLEGAHWIATSMPEGSVAGSFNSGLQVYYAERPVKNLDGVVNWGALRALDEKKLMAYLQEEDINYVVDFSFYPFQSFRPFFETDYQGQFELVATLSPEYPPYGRLQVYRVLSD